MSDYLDPENKELLNDFFEEAQMQIDTMEQNLLALEEDVNDKASVDELFRAAHTLKGGSATVAMDEITKLTHILEDVLDDVRDSKIQINEDIVSILLEALDILKEMLKNRLDGEIYSGSNVEEIKNKLHNISCSPNGEQEISIKKETTKSDSTSSDKIKVNISKEDITEILDNLTPGKNCYQIDINLNEEALMNTVSAVQVFSIIKNNIGEIYKTIPDFELLNSDVFYPVVTYVVATDCSTSEMQDLLNNPEVITSCNFLEINQSTLDNLDAESKIVEEQEIQEEQSNDEEIVEQVASSSSSKKSTNKNNKNTNSVLRVDSKKIDHILNLISEQVINKSTINQLSNNFTSIANEAIDITRDLNVQFNQMLDSLPSILKRIQDGASIDDIISEYKEQNNNINLNVEDFRNFLKKNVSDLKNSTQRLSLNTTSLQEGIMQIRMISIGTLFVRFPRVVRDLSHSLNKKVELIMEGEDTELDKSVVEELLDPLIHCVRNCVDHGIESSDVRKSLGKPEFGTVKLRAANEGSTIVIQISDDGGGIDVDKVRNKAIEKGLILPDDKLTEQECYNLLFLPGFSTASEITSVSGRGVGLDVVKTQIDSLKGVINVSSVKGVGTTFTIRLPLTLAIIQGLLIKVANENFIIPIANVIDGHRVHKDEITSIKNVEAFNIRDEIIYVLRLANFFGVEHESLDKEFEYIIIVGNGDKKMALVVDSLVGQEDVVIKPLKDDFSKSVGIAGATILGDGSVALIIDILQLLEQGLDSDLKNRDKINEIDDVLVDSTT